MYAFFHQGCFPVISLAMTLWKIVEKWLLLAAEVTYDWTVVVDYIISAYSYVYKDGFGQGFPSTTLLFIGPTHLNFIFIDTNIKEEILTSNLC